MKFNLLKMTIGKRLGLGYGIIIVLLVSSIFLVNFLLSNIKSQAVQINDKGLPYTLLGDEMVLHSIMIWQYYTNVAATRNKTGFMESEVHERKFREAVEKFKVMFRKENDVKALSHFADVESNFASFISTGKRMAQAYIKEDTEQGIILMADFDSKGSDLVYLIKGIQKTQINEIRENTSGIVDYINSAVAALILLGLIITGISVLIAFLISRSVIKGFKDIDEASETIIESGNQVTMGSQNLSQGASEQAAAVEQITSSITQLGSQSKQAANNALKVKGISETAMSDAETGAKNMAEMVTAMNDIGSSSSEIAKIMKTIDEIAFQTNLLALNAAVEAARAGQHGRGFAVVAEEVNNLSKRSAQAAKETYEIIEKSIQKVDRGKVTANNAAESFDKILSGVQNVTNLAEEISISSQEQVKGISQVEDGILQVDQVTQQNASIAEENAAITEELFTQANQMRGIVQSFIKGSGDGKVGDYITEGEEKETLRGAGRGKKEKIKDEKALAKVNEEKALEKRKVSDSKSPKGKLVKPEEIISLDGNDKNFEAFK